jgi:hypothetical protein
VNIRSYISFDGRLQNNNCISFYDMYYKSEYGRIEWKQMLRDLEKAPDVAYHDILNKFDLIWGVKGLIVTRSNLVPTWKDRPQMSIISRFPLRLRCFGWVGCILNLNFQFVPKKE